MKNYIVFMRYANNNDWALFIKERHKPPVRECIYESWLRSAEFGLDPFGSQQPLPQSDLTPRLGDEFTAKLKSLIDGPLKSISVSRVAWLLCSPDGRILEISSYNQEISELLKTSGMLASSTLSERYAGTNAVAMSIKNGQPAFCHGAEHFLKKFHSFSAAAAPFYGTDGTLKGYLSLIGMLPETDALLLGIVILFLIQLYDRELRVNRFKGLYKDLKKQFTRIYNDNLKPIVMINRNGYIRQMNPAEMEFFDFVNMSGKEKNLENLASFKPSVKEIAESAIACTDKKMEIHIADRHLDVTYEKVPLYSETDEFLGNILIFNEKGERSGTDNETVSEAKYTFDNIIGRSSNIVMAKELAMRAAKTSVNILLYGSSGTGKEMFAHSIHNASSRKKHPFVAINCAAIPREIAESELFGYAEGAFTGASKGGRIGKLESADKGTVFLDEIGDMPVELQAKLLRLLEEHTITRIGESKGTPINIRIIAATNKEIPALIEKGEFREDLYYRLNVSSISLPPLSESVEDIPEFVHYFIEYFNEIMGKKVKGVDEEMMKNFKSYSWPGNIRELRNVIEFAVMLNSGEDLITWKDLPGQFRMALLYKDPPELEVSDPLLQEKLNIESSEKAIYQKAIRLANGNMSGAAKILNVGRSTLYRKIRKFGLKF
jgi:transcriptional regulator with PAS, ATPase and Fis domain